MRNATRPIVAVLAAIVLLTPGKAAALERLCDASYENCRTPLIDLIRAETVGIDVAFWFMEDSRYTTEIIRRWQAGVPVRVIVDSRASAAYPLNATRLKELQDAGIPMRERTSLYLHWKMMLFAGQNTVQFSGANYSPDAFAPNQPYVDYVDEVLYFTDDPAVVNSFKTKYDDNWVSTNGFRDYANITVPLTRVYPTYPIDPELNFPPTENFATRSAARYNAEDVGIDAIIYRIDDSRHTNALLAAVARGVPVRILTEPTQYRDPKRLWHSYNVDRLYMGGVQVRHRAHQGLNHEKLTLLHEQRMTVFGSSNWTTSSSNQQSEHNYFTTKPWFYDWSVAHFERKWHNSQINPATGTPYIESQPFVPLPPDIPVNVTPSNGATNQPLEVTLKWNAGPWAHKYDVYFGETPDPPLIATDLALGPSESATDYVTWAVPRTLDQGKVYYWKVVSKTMANLSREGVVTSFRTLGAPPTAGVGDVVLYAWKAPVKVGNWAAVADATAAGGMRMANPNLGKAKIAAPLASPAHYFEMSFFAEAGVPYRLWLRGKAEKNSYNNDSVYVQFSDSVTAGGVETARIGTTSGLHITIEDGPSAGLSNWGWNDNGYGVGVLGAPVYFQTSGAHTLRVQVREDGLSLDQIVLSRDKFITAAPGTTKGDATVLVENGGSDGGPGAQDGGDEIVMHVAHAMQVRGKWSFVADATAASGWKLWNPNANATRPNNASAAPADYFEIAFFAKAGMPYHLWVRGQSEGNNANNDSVFVQFTGALNDAGNVAYRVGTTSSLVVALQDGTGASLRGWMWNDHGYDSFPPHIMFDETGWHTIRVQRREDGVYIDQIVLSSARYLAERPGAARDDTTVLQTSSPRHPSVPAPPPPPPPPPPPDPDPNATNIVLHTADAVLAGAWTRVDDPAAASGSAVVLPDAARAKVTTASTNPANYFTMTFTASAYTPYRIWIRGRALNNNKDNDSVHVQFSDSIDDAGASAYRIGTSSSIEVNLEHCTGCGIAGWGWQDNGWGTPTTLGAEIRFTTTGTHTIKVQNREDGFYIDQIVLSPNTYRAVAPGADRNDTTILPKTQP